MDHEDQLREEKEYGLECCSGLNAILAIKSSWGILCIYFKADLCFFFTYTFTGMRQLQYLILKYDDDLFLLLCMISCQASRNM